MYSTQKKKQMDFFLINLFVNFVSMYFYFYFDLFTSKCYNFDNLPN